MPFHTNQFGLGKRHWNLESGNLFSGSWISAFTFNFYVLYNNLFSDLDGARSQIHVMFEINVQTGVSAHKIMHNSLINKHHRLSSQHCRWLFKFVFRKPEVCKAHRQLPRSPVHHRTRDLTLYGLSRMSCQRLTCITFEVRLWRCGNCHVPSSDSYLHDRIHILTFRFQTRV